MVIKLILASAYFFLPAYIANMAPVLFKWLPFLERPIHEKKLGKNKTWRGLVVGTILGTLTFLLQQLAHNAGFTTLSLIEYTHFSLFLGFLISFGALAGDAIKSYYKRKAEIPAGKSWPFFDQIDFVLGGLAGSFILYVPKAEVVLILMIFSPALHILVNHIGYWLGIRKVKW